MTFDPQKTPLGNSDWVAEIPLVNTDGTLLTGEVNCDFNTCKSDATQYVRTGCCKKAFWYCDYHMSNVINAIIAGAYVACDNCDTVFEDLKSLTAPKPLSLED